MTEVSAQKPGRFRFCEVCGETFDTTDGDQVFHHTPEPHQPLGSSRVAMDEPGQAHPVRQA